MRRRKKKPIVQNAWLEWTPDLAAAFRLVPNDFKPPAKVRASYGRAHITLTGAFTGPDGGQMKALVRIVRSADGWSLGDETLHIRLVGRAA